MAEEPVESEAEAAKAKRERLEGAGAATGGALGCLAAASMPWIVIVAVLAILAVAWFIGKAMR